MPTTRCPPPTPVRQGVARRRRDCDYDRDHRRRGDDPEYVAIILAATRGSRLYPLTSGGGGGDDDDDDDDDVDDIGGGGRTKHLLPVSPLRTAPGDDGRDRDDDDDDDDDDDGGGTLSTPLGRLLSRVHVAGFDVVVVAIRSSDDVTVPCMLGWGGIVPVGSSSSSSSSSPSPPSPSGGRRRIDVDDDDDDDDDRDRRDGNGETRAIVTDLTYRGTTLVRVVRLPSDCRGSADALRFLSSYSSSSSSSDDGVDDGGSSGGGESSGGVGIGDGRRDDNRSRGRCRGRGFRGVDALLPRSSHAVVMPGDLMLECDLPDRRRVDDDEDATTRGGGGGGDDDVCVLSSLVEAHRRWNSTSATRGGGGAACTMLLTDVGAEDGNGVPLGESTKSRLGMQARTEEDVEYVGLSTEIPPPTSGSLASLSHSRRTTTTATTRPSSRRVVLKRSKVEVEVDEGTGSTPKLVVARRRLHAADVDRRSDAVASRGAGRRPAVVAASDTDASDRSPSMMIRTDLLDVHLYVVSNWVLRLIQARPRMQSFQAEVLPLLISRQFRGVEAAFGPTAWRVESNRERLIRVLREMDGVVQQEDGGGGSRGFASYRDGISTLLGMYASGRASGGLGAFVPNDDYDEDEDDDANRPAGRGGMGGDEMDTTSTSASPGVDLVPSGPTFPSSRHRFAVSALVLSREASSLVLRTRTLPSLLYGCGEVTSRILKLDPVTSSSLVVSGARLSTKFNSILMPGCSLGEKVQTKSCTIGKGVVIGDKAKLNNVVVMDGATIGPNTVLQQCIVGANARIGANCNLKDCQVGPGVVIGVGTTERGSS
ncbi:hypothetical protein ACHAW5_000420 [Stephanodiscus triporus]|uniref:Mannose-1-phosphate guanyltransferase C-terminal domain-containing protein n=1 Tax=Stephanodiscus triporus TaxID=2934178 RepID=A0ABD3MLX9_9STRA